MNWSSWRRTIGKTVFPFIWPGEQCLRLKFWKFPVSFTFPPNRSNFFHVNVGREVDVWRKEIDLIKFEVDVWNFKLWYLELRDVKFQVRTLTFDVHVIEILQRHLKS